MQQPRDCSLPCECDTWLIAPWERQGEFEPHHNRRSKAPHPARIAHCRWSPRKGRERRAPERTIPPGRVDPLSQPGQPGRRDPVGLEVRRVLPVRRPPLHQAGRAGPGRPWDRVGLRRKPPGMLLR
jgi:hypothetical protein